MPSPFLDPLREYLMAGGGELPWAALGVLLILLATAAWDGWTGIVPDSALAIGGAGAIAFLFWKIPTSQAVWPMIFAAGTIAILWFINEAWYRAFGRDAIGMGDVKWTALAVLAFGIAPAIWAWLAGSWFAVAWIGGARLCGFKLEKVYFAPFLFIGLMIGLASPLLPLPEFPPL